MKRDYISTRNLVQLEHSDKFLLCHPVDECEGDRCPLHNRSDHHMRDWPQHWRGDRGIIERICPCGVGHPDPDDLTDERSHGCCGCCAAEEVK